MDDLISRQDAIDALMKEFKRVPTVAIRAKTVIGVLPPAQPKHGRWLHGREVSRDYIGDTCVAIHYEKWWCSECDYPVDGHPLWGRPLWNYCPICGARNEADK